MPRNLESMSPPVRGLGFLNALRTYDSLPQQKPKSLLNAPPESVKRSVRLPLTQDVCELAAACPVTTTPPHRRELSA
jgi:hypothetical protein